MSGPEAGGDPRGSSVPRAGWASGGRGGAALRAGRGGARAAPAGSPGGVRGGRRDPSPKGRGGGAAARRSARAAESGSGARGFSSRAWGAGGGLSPPEPGSDPGPQSRRGPPGVTSCPGPGPPGVTSSPTALDPGVRGAPCWRATSAWRGCPPRKPPRPVSTQGRRGGRGTPRAAASASGTPGDDGFPGTEGRARSGRQGPPVSGGGTVPAPLRGGGLCRPRGTGDIAQQTAAGRAGCGAGCNPQAGGRPPVPGEHLQPARRFRGPSGWKGFGCFYRRY